MYNSPSLNQQYRYSRLDKDPVCKNQQARFGRCSAKTQPYGDLEYLFKCAPHADLDVKFHTGGHFDTLYSAPCQRYLTETCARSWSPVCEAFALNKEPSRFPLVDTVPPSPCEQPLNKGQQFLRQVLTERYCDFPGYQGIPQLLDPTDPDSPTYHYKVPVDRGAHIVMQKVPKEDPFYELTQRVGGSDDFLEK